MIFGGRKPAVKPAELEPAMTEAERRYHESNQWGR